MLAGLTTIAWQNSHATAGIVLRMDMQQRELEYHRKQIEQLLGCERTKQ